MAFDIYAKEFAHCKSVLYSLKVQADDINKFYTCNVEWVSKLRNE